MSALAPLLEAFFTERLVGQRQASPHTVAAYRDAFCLLLRFARQRTGRAPHQLTIEDLDAALIGAFLHHLEAERRASVRTRNARLTAIRSLFNFAAYRHPEHAALIGRVLAIPPKKTDRALVTYLSEEEADALLAAPDLSTWLGRRDRALLLVALETGLRVSELTGLTCGAVQLGTGAHVRCTGKGRKERITPLRREAQEVLRAWLRERRGAPDNALFPGPRGDHLSRDAVRRLVERHVATAAAACPSLTGKEITPHTLRHSCVMNLLRHGVDTATIALVLGHEDVRTTYGVYLHADLGLNLDPPTGPVVCGFPVLVGARSVLPLRSLAAGRCRGALDQDLTSRGLSALGGAVCGAPVARGGATRWGWAASGAGRGDERTIAPKASAAVLAGWGCRPG